MKLLRKKDYFAAIDRTRPQRMKWWHEARYGMFVHWGLYSLIGRNEWVHAIEGIPMKEYEKLALKFKPKASPARAWARLAKESGMKYMVLTTKHHEGFCLWPTKQTDFNAGKCCGRDLVGEYVKACRDEGLNIGFYYSLMDWHNPDGAACAYDSAARKRFNDFTMGCVRELMTRYGRIDILWYDVARPLSSHEGWDSLRMNQMVRDLQPHILINDRSLLPEDFSTPEESVKAAEEGRGWEACMTFNATSWGWMPSAAQDSHTPRSIVRMLNTACNGAGNLLLNIGPAPDGSVPEEAVDPLRTVGKWLKLNKDAVYGRLDRCAVHNWNCTICGDFSQKGKKLYFWVRNWPGRTVNLGGKFTELKAARFLAGGKPVRFEQTPGRIILKDLPEECPDTLVGYSVIELTFAKPPVQTYYSETPALTSGD